jgi:hypothetical protein
MKAKRGPCGREALHALGRDARVDNVQVAELVEGGERVEDGVTHGRSAEMKVLELCGHLR